jgi:thiol-disulfide isomerase/thioredoxin
VERYQDRNSKATAALQDGRNKKAAHLYERAARIHSGNDGLYYNLACAYAKANQTALALSALDRSLEAGWADAQWPAKDSDLASIHDTVGFEEWTERVAAQDSNPAWPIPDAASLASDAEEIEDESDDWTAELRRLRGVLGRTESTQANREIAAWKAASWDRIAAQSADEDVRAEAGREALAAIAGTDPTRLSPVATAEVLRRTDNWLEEFGDHEDAGAVRLTHAEAMHAKRTSSDDEMIREDARELFERDLLVLAATTPSGAGLEGALVRLIGFNADNMDRATLLYDRLIDSTDDADAARTKMRGGYSTRGIAYKVEGLPEFEAVSTDGETFGRTDLPGRITLLDFWATWCGPCRKELPNLKAAYEEYHEAGFDIVGISLDNEKSKDQQAFLAWCEENDMPWPQVYDGKGWSSRLAGEFGVRAIPFALLVDDEGNVLAADDDLRGESLSEVVAEALSPGAPAIGGQ